MTERKTDGATARYGGMFLAFACGAILAAIISVVMGSSDVRTKGKDSPELDLVGSAACRFLISLGQVFDEFESEVDEVTYKGFKLHFQKLQDLPGVISLGVQIHADDGPYIPGCFALNPNDRLNFSKESNSLIIDTVESPDITVHRGFVRTHSTPSVRQEQIDGVERKLLSSIEAVEYRCSTTVSGIHIESWATFQEGSAKPEESVQQVRQH